MDNTDLPQVSEGFYIRLSRHVIKPDIRPETIRDRWIWDAAQTDLLKRIEGATKFKSGHIVDPKDYRTTHLSNSVSEPSTQSNTQTTTTTNQMRPTLVVASDDTYKQRRTKPLWRRALGLS